MELFFTGLGFSIRVDTDYLTATHVSSFFFAKIANLQIARVSEYLLLDLCEKTSLPIVLHERLRTEQNEQRVRQSYLGSAALRSLWHAVLLEKRGRNWSVRQCQTAPQ